MENWITDARETKVLEEKLTTTEAQLLSSEAQMQQLIQDIEDLDTATHDEGPENGNNQLVPSAIIGLGIIIAAVLLLQKDRL